MNKLIIIGNLTRDPELRSTPSGIAVCNFTVAVNRRNRSQTDGGQQEVDYIRVTAWRQLAENCHRYLAKGRKVYCAGPASASTYQGRDGSARVQLEMTADEVEFLSSRNEAQQPADPQETAYQQQERQSMRDEVTGGFTAVEDDELPF